MSRVLAAAGLDEPPSPFVLAFCDGGYTTNLPVEDLLEDKALVVWEYDGEPLDPEHGGPARLLVPHLYFWKSAKWIRGLRLLGGFLLIRPGHGRDQDSAGPQDRERTVLCVTADGIQHDIDVGEDIVEPRSPPINDTVRTECPDVLDIRR